jgi:hypothetical protein
MNLIGPNKNRLVAVYNGSNLFPRFVFQINVMAQVTTGRSSHWLPTGQVTWQLLPAGLRIEREGGFQHHKSGGGHGEWPIIARESIEGRGVGESFGSGIAENIRGILWQELIRRSGGGRGQPRVDWRRGSARQKLLPPTFVNAP